MPTPTTTTGWCGSPSSTTVSGSISGRLDRRSEGHLGLLLLIDRVENLGGTLTVAAGPEGGTAVTATLPFAAASTTATTSTDDLVDD